VRSQFFFFFGLANHFFSLVPRKVLVSLEIVNGRFRLYMKRDGGEDGGLRPGGSETVIHRLTSVQDGRLGKLLNQLQILGVEKMHLDRIKAQLQSALGDDSGKKFRILQQAVEQLVRDKSLGRELATAADEGEDDAKPHDIERLVACVFVYSTP